jgi:hypothetical protein
MRNFDDAEAVYQKTKDPFYLGAFLIQCWLSNLVQQAAAEYAEKKNPKERLIQRGEAWRAFQQFFNPQAAQSRHYHLSLLFRFSAADPSPRNLLRQALVPLGIEHHSTGDFFGPKTMLLIQSGSLNTQPATLNQLSLRTLVRWCDWLDAAVHLRTHRHWHYAPACFDPDPQTRWLAELGNAQLHLTDLDQRGQLAWLQDFAQAAVQFRGSPKLAALAKGMKSDPSWQYADVDTLVISLWPLVTRYNWTYRDLLNTIGPALQRPSCPPSDSDSSLCTLHPALRYPCSREQEFATYCANILGLRKSGKGATAKSGHPKGHDIALQYCPSLQKNTPPAA